MSRSPGCSVGAVPGSTDAPRRSGDHAIRGLAGHGLAAAATAYSTGVQTANGMVGLGPDGVARQTVVELAESRGLATGLVTTAGFADATPAAFAAHHRDRKDARALAQQIARSGVDVLVSSGLERFGIDLPALEELARAGGDEPAHGVAALHAATTI